MPQLSRPLSDLPDFLIVSEVAELLRCSPNHIYALVRDGVLPGCRLGRRLVVPRAALERMIAHPSKEAVTRC
jgi:excisionase family DNA binding protein